ncbi:MAG: hypothetical protein KGH57_02955 [Candidatus Micrarchaeota archaeon]|nr:hypothetical protein [Candidatus Micrarchaeota archaeon]
MRNAKRVKKAQSAMEYLMTYGWAILIIGVVLAGLFYLGVFNAFTLAPRAQTGSCQVYRPYGPWSVSLVALTGVCTGSLPQYVAESTYGYIQTNTALPKLTQYTVVGWINNQYPPSGESGHTLAQGNIYLVPNGNTYEMEMDTNGGLKYASNGLQAQPIGAAVISGLQYGAWYMLAQTVDSNGNTVNYAYSPGKTTPTTASQSYGQAVYQPSSTWCLGSWACNLATYPFNGELSNIQIYNASLSSNELGNIYLEGIGGAPTVLQNLVAWWPLNGNINDYSGNNKTAYGNNVIFSGTLTGYTVP